MSARVNETPAPDVAIRAKPPSPRRLSRRVLLAGAVCTGAVIAFAVVTGLSTPARAPGGQSPSAAAATTLPDSISQAASQYDASALTRPNPAAPVADELAPPTDPVWSSNASAPASASQAGAAPDPRAGAYASPILFAAGAAARGPASSSGAGASARLDSQLTPPRSPYEIMAGDVIPAALVTALNSDAPGRVIAQVTAPVYDTVTGTHLLIPQGARLIGAYDNGVHYGDARIVLSWDRLILPNGFSIDLGAMNGADPTGAAGVADAVDNHLWRLGGAVGLSAIISVIADNSERDDRSSSLTQGVGDAAAQQAAQTGSQIVGRELAVKPTLRVRAGANVRVLVMRDIELRPYENGGSDGERRTP